MATPLNFTVGTHTFYLINTNLVEGASRQNLFSILPNFEWQMWKAQMMDKDVKVGTTALCSERETLNGKLSYFIQRSGEKVWNCFTIYHKKESTLPFDYNMRLGKIYKDIEGAEEA